MPIPQEFIPSIWGNWLGDKANNIWKDSINPYLNHLIESPWPSLSYCPPKETRDVLEWKQKLHEDLATLAKGTVPMGRPGRITPPTYGVIAGQRVSQLGSFSQTPDHEPAGVHQHTASRNPIAHTFPGNEDTTQAMTLPKPSFEIRTSSSTLPAHLADLYASTTPLGIQSLDDDVSDENKPPLHPFEGETAQGPVMLRGAEIIPEPRFRVKREPFAVLHLALAQEKPESDMTQQEDANYESQTAYGDGRLKGLRRLRAKAPPPIDMNLVNKAAQPEKASVLTSTPHDSAMSLDEIAVSRVERVRMTRKREITNAPVMSSVPLPPISPIASRSRVSGELELGLLFPVPRMPITPGRQALLDILNGKSLIDERVGKDRQV